MTVASSSSGPTARKGSPRGRGRPAKINRAMIVRAAREIPSDELSVRAVADRLGAARRSVSHYVAGVDELRRLVAAADLMDALESVQLPKGDWRAAIRSYAAAAAGFLASNPAAAVVIDEIPLPGSLRLIEHLLAEFEDAGVDVRIGASVVAIINDVVVAQVRRESTAPGDGEPDQVLMARTTVTRRPGQFPLLESLLTDSRTALRGDETAILVELVIGAVENRLAPHRDRR